jgi:hypothetical protein
MSQLDRTKDRSSEFDVSLQAVLGLAWLLSQVDALRPDVEAAGSRAETAAASSPSSDHDPASLAVLGVIAVACELSPMLEAVRADSPRQSHTGVRAGGRGEIERIELERRGALRPNQGALGGLLR